MVASYSNIEASKYMISCFSKKENFEVPPITLFVGALLGACVFGFFFL
jgi:hypothetical protein